MARILSRHGVTRIFELSREQYCQVTDVEFFDASASEVFYFSDEMDWLVYSSHEMSTTVAGDWLIAEVKAAWPSWEDHLWG